MRKKTILKIDPDLEDIIPGYLENRRKDLAAMPLLLKQGDFDALRVMGHKMRGSGGGYGMDFLTAFGARLEAAAQNKEQPAIKELAGELGDFLDSLEIVYGGPN
jgi:hypothetical protein